MSDITGPPGQGNNNPVPRVADSAAAAGREPRQNSTNARSQSGQSEAGDTSAATSNTRDPAVTISAQTAGLRVGQEIERRVDRLDSEGRPIIVTEEATFALRPDAGLRPGDDVALEIREAGRQVVADLVAQNGRAVDPPTRLELIVVEVRGSGRQASNEQTLAATGTVSQGSNAPGTDAQQGNVQTYQVSSLSGSGQPALTIDGSRFGLVSSATIQPGDDITLRLVTRQVSEALSAAAAAQSAELLAVNGNTLSPPSAVQLVPLTPQGSAASNPATGSTPERSASNATATIPSITLSEADRTLPPTGDPRTQRPRPTPEAIAQTLAARPPLQSTPAQSNPAPPTLSPSSTQAFATTPRNTELANTVSNLAGTGSNQINRVQAPQVSLSTPDPVSGPTAGEVPNSPSIQVSAQTSSLTPGAASSRVISETRSPTLSAPVIEAFTLNGRPQALRVLDVSTSQVSPAVVAQVNSFAPLTIEETRNLALPINAFATLSDELARVNTSRGVLITPLEAARTLVGETIELIPSARTDITSQQTRASAYATSGSQASEVNNPTGVGALLQSLPVYSASYSSGPPDADAPTSQVNVVFVQRSTIEASAREAADTANSGTPSPPANSGAIGQLAALAAAQSRVTSRGVSAPSAPGELTFGPSNITRVESLPATGVSTVEQYRLETTLGTLVLDIPPGLQVNGGDIAIILPDNESDATSGAERALAVATALASNSALVNAAPLDTISLTGWPALAAGVSILNQQSPGLANSLATRSASGGGRLSNSLLFFLAAAQNGGADDWIGRDISAELSRANEKILDTLKRDLSRLFNAANDTSGEWRPVSLPLDARAGDTPFITMLLRNDPDDPHKGRSSEQETGDNGNRFILEIDFRRVGAVQLDGFIKKQRFDLTVRSAKPLPKGLTTEMRALFASALEANGYAGALTIEPETPFRINVHEVLSKSGEDKGEREQVS